MRQALFGRRWKRSIGYALLAGFIAAGCLGILVALAPIASQRSAPSAEIGHDRLSSYAERRVTHLRERLRATPNDPDLRLELAHAYALRATARAHQAYTAEFPNGSVRDDHYVLWLRGWHRRDPEGDLRLALTHARGALASSRRRLDALRLIAHILRQQSRSAAAAASLREIVAIQPDDQAAWLQLCLIYSTLGDLPRLREARRRLKALGTAGGGAMPEK
jgi:hypothetical protein